MFANYKSLASVLVGISCSFAISAPLPDCPKILSVSEVAQSSPTGWDQSSYSVARIFNRVSFKAHSDAGELRPDDEKGKPGNRLLMWDVDGIKGLEQVCAYAGTVARLTRSVSGYFKVCSAREERLSDGGSNFKIECH